MRVAGPRSRGFTLMEVLVALAIMVVLFALLFAPMMAGLDWVSTGKANVGLQDACRYAMEQVRRELGEAAYVYKTPGIHLPVQGLQVPNYSTVLFCPPARDSFGKIAYPLRPAEVAVDWNDDGVADATLRSVVQYCVRLVNPAVEYSSDNPFALYRQEYLYNPWQPNPLGSFDSGGNWLGGTPQAENALTPKRGATFVPSTTVCTAPVGGNPCGARTEGYATTCPVCGNSDPAYLTYLFNGVRFVPQRIVGEQLRTENGIVYKASAGYWDGLAPGPNSALGNQALHVSELDPRVMLAMWSPSAGSYPTLRSGMDSYISATRSERITWDSETGEVRCGTEAKDRTLTVTVGTWHLANNAAAPEIEPIYPADTAAPPPDTANAPVAYRIDPAIFLGGPAIIEPGSIKVRLTATINGVPRQFELKPTGNFDQTDIARDEFCPLIYRRDYDANGTPDGTCAEIRLSRYDPPRLTVSPYYVEISYLARRNYVYDATRDSAGQDPFVNDVVKVDYSTRAIQNVTIALQRYVELDEVSTGVFRLPADEYPNEVTVREQVTVRNMLRSEGR